MGGMDRFKVNSLIGGLIQVQTNPLPFRTSHAQLGFALATCMARQVVGRPAFRVAPVRRTSCSAAATPVPLHELLPGSRREGL